jgi:hypothetical protein
MRLSFRPGGSSHFLPQASLPGHLFYGRKNSAHEKQTHFFFYKNEAETDGRQWKKEVGRSRRAQPEEAVDLLHGKPVRLERSFSCCYQQ